MRNELLRKGAHAGLALFFVFAAPHASKEILILFTVFFLLLFILMRVGNFFKNIFSVSRVTYGELFFIFGVFGTVLLSWPNVHLFQVALIVLALADPLASLFGMNFGKYSYTIFDEKRTAEGSFVCFFVVVCILISFSVPLYISAMTAVGVMLIEAMSIRGTDNMFIPLGVVVLLKIFHGVAFLDVLNTIHI